MQLGAVFPTCEIGNDPAVIRDYVHTAEGLGYDRLVIFDHVLGAEHAGREPALTGPYTEAHAFHEPMVLFGYLAAVSTTIKLETGVIVLPQRQTALLAKQAVEVDLLSGGRLVLGVGTGWNHVEYTALGEDYRTRGAKLEEQVTLLRRLWREPLIDYTGRFHRVERAGILPLPTRPIPIWFGGYADAALSRSARLGDGHIFGSSGPRTRDLAVKLQELVAAAGRAPEAVPMEQIVDWSFGPARWVETAANWEASGGTVLSLRTMNTTSTVQPSAGSGLSTPAEHIAALETFARAVRG